MKALSICLAVYIGFLSIRPVMVKIELASTPLIEHFCSSVCSTETTSNCCEQRAERECFPKDCSEPCSPCACGLYCFYCVVQSSNNEPFLPSGFAGQKIVESYHLASGYHADCFHPPELS